ncbi:MAG TPA: hypothetical protein VKH63_23495 [Candidatus Acidoferrum sp.]|nr:hypothetical protein [Candidatus Acidoferrum sp.]
MTLRSRDIKLIEKRVYRRIFPERITLRIIEVGLGDPAYEGIPRRLFISSEIQGEEA